MATNCLNCQDNQNTVAFENHATKENKQIKTHLAEIANQGPTETTDPNRCQFTTTNEPQQYQSTYTSQNKRSSIHSYNCNFHCTWQSHTDRNCNSCGTKGHIAKHCTKQTFWCQWCHTTTHDTAACRFKPRSSTPMESPSAGSYHPTQSPNQHNTSSHPPVQGPKLQCSCQLHTLLMLRAS